jgi:APA family basic amino acid/polyamine antiporter
MPILINIPAFSIVALITWLLPAGRARKHQGEQRHGGDQAAGARAVHPRRRDAPEHGELHAVCAERLHGDHQGAAIVFFAYIGFDAISTAAEETMNPQRNLPIGILGGLAVCTVIYVIVGAVLTGMVPYKQLANSADPLSYALQAAGFQRVGWVVALGAAVSMSAVLPGVSSTAAADLLLDGARRPASAVGSEGAPGARGFRTRPRCSRVSSWRWRR